MIRLCSGSKELTRRAKLSRVNASRSRSGSCPRNESLKPPLPDLLPWQVPALQPALEMTGSTSLRKETAACVALFSASSSPVNVAHTKVFHVRGTTTQTRIHGGEVNAKLTTSE